MILQKNNFFWFKFNALSRYALIHLFSGSFPLFVINEYPKSGGSWVGQLLSESLGIPFPRNRLPMLKKSIMHEHMMHSWNVDNLLIVWRDGRDILVSQYFHSLLYNEKGNKVLVDKCRADLKFEDYNDVRGNLPAFMEYVYETRAHPRMSWSQFVSKWAGRDDCVYVKYEELIENPCQALKRVLKELAGVELDDSRIEEIVSKYSFEKIAGRKSGVEKTNSFLRKGIVGDWRNNFTEEAKVKFNNYAGETLIRLGYKKDSSWLK